MGNRIPSLDMLLGNFIHPIMNCYSYGQYEKAARLLWLLDNFLLGFGEGVSDMPQPLSITNDIISRSFPDRDYANYFNKYAPTIFKKMGKYNRAVLDSLPKQFFIPEEAKEITAELGG